MKSKQFHSLYFFFLGILIVSQISLCKYEEIYNPYAKITVFVGNILFPQSIQTIPQLSLFKSGTKIKCEFDNTGKKIQFSISENKDCDIFYLIIAQTIYPSIQDNIVQYLKVDPKHNYLFYKIKLVRPKTINTEFDSEIQQITYNSEKPLMKEIPAHWLIFKESTDDKGRIPDEALIIICNPAFVEKLEGGTEFELPKIIMKSNLVELAGGSEKNLHDQEAELLLSSLDLNLIHAKLDPIIKQNASHKLIIAKVNP